VAAAAVFEGQPRFQEAIKLLLVIELRPLGLVLQQGAVRAIERRGSLCRGDPGLDARDQL
jgi:hypothetical protein